MSDSKAANNGLELSLGEEGARGDHRRVLLAVLAAVLIREAHDRGLGSRVISLSKAERRAASSE